MIIKNSKCILLFFIDCWYLFIGFIFFLYEYMLVYIEYIFEMKNFIIGSLYFLGIYVNLKVINGFLVDDEFIYVER